MLVKHYFSWFKTVGRWVGKFTLIAIALLTCCYIYSSRIEPNWIEVVPIKLTIPNLSTEFDEFKIVQISDLHTNRFMPKKRLERIIKSVNRQQPDAIAITGDIITRGNHFDPQTLEQQLSKLKAKTRTLAVLGNHDHWGKQLNELKQVLASSNINILDNQVYEVERGGKKLAFAGVDDPYWGKPDLEKVIAQLPENSVAVLLVHEPDYIEKTATTHKFALQLSGHSHGGQIRIPFLDPLVLPYGGKKYFVGLSKVEETIEYTNRGLGMTGLPLRFNSRPEITVFTLHTL